MRSLSVDIQTGLGLLFGARVRSVATWARDLRIVLVTMHLYEAYDITGMAIRKDKTQVEPPALASRRECSLLEGLGDG